MNSLPAGEGRAAALAKFKELGIGAPDKADPTKWVASLTGAREDQWQAVFEAFQ